MVEKVLLPNGGKDFTLDVPPVDKTLAATHIWRTVTMEGGTVTATSNFKRLGRELAATEARSAPAELDKVSDAYAYVVSKKKLKLPAD